MVRQDENTKSVRFPEAVDERLTLLARKLGAPSGKWSCRWWIISTKARKTPPT